MKKAKPYLFSCLSSVGKRANRELLSRYIGVDLSTIPTVIDMLENDPLACLPTLLAWLCTSKDLISAY